MAPQMTPTPSESALNQLINSSGVGIWCWYSFQEFNPGRLDPSEATGTATMPALANLSAVVRISLLIRQPLR